MDKFSALPKSAFAPFNIQAPQDRSDFIRRWMVLVGWLWGARCTLAIIIYSLNQGSLAALALLVMIGPILGTLTMIGLVAYYPWLVIAGLRACRWSVGVLILLAIGVTLVLRSASMVGIDHIPGSEIFIIWKAFTDPAVLISLLIFCYPLPRASPRADIEHKNPNIDQYSQ